MHETHLDSTSISLSLNDLMSERSRNCLDDSSESKQTNTDPYKKIEALKKYISREIQGGLA